MILLKDNKLWQAIQKELAKRTSISLENMQKAKITGFNIIEKSTGKFVIKVIFGSAAKSGINQTIP